MSEHSADYDARIAEAERRGAERGYDEAHATFCDMAGNCMGGCYHEDSNPYRVIPPEVTDASNLDTRQDPGEGDDRAE